MNDLRMFIPFFVCCVLLVFSTIMVAIHPFLMPILVVPSIGFGIFGIAGLVIKFG